MEFTVGYVGDVKVSKRTGRKYRLVIVDELEDEEQKMWLCIDCFDDEIVKGCGLCESNKRSYYGSYYKEPAQLWTQTMDLVKLMKMPSYKEMYAIFKKNM